MSRSDRACWHSWQLCWLPERLRRSASVAE